jgi:hypothetical protein
VATVAVKVVCELSFACAEVKALDVAAPLNAWTTILMMPVSGGEDCAVTVIVCDVLAATL